MPGRSKITTDDEGRSALRVLARSTRRSEADRARAILMTLAGQRSAEIAASLGVQASTVREWRGLFRRSGVAALRPRAPSGRPSRIGAAAAALAEAILAEDACHDRGWAGPCPGSARRSSAGVGRRSATPGSRRSCAARLQLAPAAAHAQGPPGRRGRRRPPPAAGRAEAAGRGGRDRPALPRRGGGPHPSLPGPPLGPAWDGPAHRGAGPG
jgi:transposase-like protein